MEERSKNMFLPIIKEHIMSDMWKAYDCLQAKGYVHLTVNHSLNFVDPDTGAYTQKIESTWLAVLPRTGRSKDHYDSFFFN